MKKVEENPICYRGKQVILRPVNPEQDLPKVWQWINDPEVIQFTKAMPPLSLYKEKEFLEKAGTSETDVIFAIETKEKRNFIGLMGLHQISRIHRTATTGAMIGEKEYWGKGLGTDAKMLVLHHAFHMLNMRRINSSTIQFNKRSQAYLLKTGYRKEGVRKAMFFRKGQYWDQVLFGLFREDFEPLWKKYSAEKGLIV